MRSGPRLTRRAALALPAALAGEMTPTTGRAGDVGELVLSAASAAVPFDRAAYGTVGIYDIDWLLQPEFGRLLDYLAASPGAFAGVRCFGCFTAGTPELLAPAGGGTVWPAPDQPMDFSRVLAALDALTTRGLVPFLALGFFPPAVSPSPITPPAAWDGWQRLVRAFLEGLAADRRFGPAAIATWRFEVWNEPNEGRFWRGTQADYLGLYRATAEAVAQTGLAIRLGGPAIAYKPQVDLASGAPWLAPFFALLAEEPAVTTAFVSFHRKGTVGDDPPDPRRLYDAAVATADQALPLGRRLGIVNDEADEKVGFEVPYAPRLDERNAAWLAAGAAIHAGLDRRYAGAGLRFAAAADNANLQLVQAPFDGRRSILTVTGTGSRSDLLKLPAFGFYELLRLQGDRQCAVAAGEERVFPATDLYHLATAGDDGVAVLLSHYPDATRTDSRPRAVELVVTDIPWPAVNVARFQIDGAHTNAYAAAGGSPANPFPVPDPARLPAIRRAQELALLRPVARDLPCPNGRYRERIALPPYATTCLWITPYASDAPPTPAWLAATVEDGNAVLRWTPNREPGFLGYELYRMEGDAPAERLSPDPLRGALWVDTAPPPGQRVYGVRAVTASGVRSGLAVGPPVVMPGSAG